MDVAALRVIVPFSRERSFTVTAFLTAFARVTPFAAFVLFARLGAFAMLPPLRLSGGRAAARGNGVRRAFAQHPPLEAGVQPDEPDRVDEPERRFGRGHEPHCV